MLDLFRIGAIKPRKRKPVRHGQAIRTGAKVNWISILCLAFTYRPYKLINKVRSHFQSKIKFASVLMFKVY
jgi:hypothetical protein